MGAIAERLADEVLVTSDNPRSEDPAAIGAQILAGMLHPERAQWISDRALAIRTAIALAGPDDLVLLAGKGHESTQTTAQVVISLDDAALARQILGEIARD
jgi:UDP-N-acetylmuramoyl-L-alanyl-D-glutamate--2,6-diaminopimelate ligase